MISLGSKIVCPVSPLLRLTAYGSPSLIQTNPLGSLGSSFVRKRGVRHSPWMMLLRSVICLLMALNRLFRSSTNSCLILESVSLLTRASFAEICVPPMNTRKSCSSNTHNFWMIFSSTSSRYVDSTATHPIARSCASSRVTSDSSTLFLGGIC
jgi:hypothetical protein